MCVCVWGNIKINAGTKGWTLVKIEISAGTKGRTLVKIEVSARTKGWTLVKGNCCIFPPFQDFHRQKS